MTGRASWIVPVSLFLFRLFGGGMLRAQDSLWNELSPGELLEQAAPGGDTPTLDMSPLDARLAPPDFTLTFRSRVNAGLERPKGFADGLYPGSPLKWYGRAELGLGSGVSGGLLLEKDPGERRAADFASGYALVSGAGPVAALIAGDYVIEAGQGIALWRGFDYGKGAEVARGAKRNGRGIVPYRSSGESAFLRGVAAELRADPLTVTLFWSRRSLAASSDSSGLITSLYTSGLFRTDAEESKRDKLGEELAGVRVAAGGGAGPGAGITLYKARFSDRLRLAGERRFSGDRYALVSADYTFGFHESLFFGEWAFTGGPPGGISGALAHPLRGTELVALFRHYPPGFATLHGLGFGERPSTSGEEGIYLGIRSAVTKGITLSTYCDQFTFAEGSPGAPFPSSGREWLLECAVRPRPGLEARVSYQRKSTETRSPLADARGLPRTLTEVRNTGRLRGRIEVRLGNGVTIGSRLERLSLDPGGEGAREEGTMLYEDAGIVPAGFCSLRLRVVLFGTGSYDSRLYEFEDDLPGTLSMPALFGRGDRWYLLLRMEAGKGRGLSVKYSRLERDDVRRIGTGPDELPGNSDERVGVQLDFTL